MPFENMNTDTPARQSRSYKSCSSSSHAAAAEGVGASRVDAGDSRGEGEAGRTGPAEVSLTAYLSYRSESVGPVRRK